MTFALLEQGATVAVIVLVVCVVIVAVLKS
jgi:hypothetical protein